MVRDTLEERLRRQREPTEVEHADDDAKARKARWERGQREMLVEVVRVLRSVPDDAPGCLSRPTAHIAADAIERYLAGEERSLDRALMLDRPGRSSRGGRPRLGADAIGGGSVPERVYALRKAGASWGAVAAEVGKDAAQCRRLYKRQAETVERIASLWPLLQDD